MTKNENWEETRLISWQKKNVHNLAAFSYCVRSILNCRFLVHFLSQKNAPFSLICDAARVNYTRVRIPLTLTYVFWCALFIFVSFVQIWWILFNLFAFKIKYPRFASLLQSRFYPVSRYVWNSSKVILFDKTINIKFKNIKILNGNPV